MGLGVKTRGRIYCSIVTALGLSEDQLRTALDYACLVASLTVARAGADPPWKSELIPA